MSPENQVTPSRFRAGTLLPPLLIVGMGLAFFHILWTQSEILYSKHSDVIAQFLSMKAIGRTAMLEEGRFPLWNPSMNGGAPAFANPESAYLFPIDLFLMNLPLEAATNLSFLLNALLAGLAMYLFARRLFGNTATALLCGAAYMMSYRYVALMYTGWLPKASMYALTPLLFWSCDALLGSPDRRRIAILSLVCALTLLQGDMQQLYYAGISCLLYSVFKLRGLPKALAYRTAGGLAAGALLGALVAAPALLPRLEYASLSTRTTPNYDFFLGDPVELADLGTIADPRDMAGERNEFWEGNFYFGFWMLPLWLYGLFAARRRALTLSLCLLATVLLCFDSLILKGLFAFLPGFDLFRLSPRILFMGQFLATLLAGVGAHALLTRDPSVENRWVFPAFAATGGLAALFFGYWLAAPPLYAVAALLILLSAIGHLRGTASFAVVAVLCLMPIADTGLRMQTLLDTAPLKTAMPATAFHGQLKRGNTDGRVLAVGRKTIPYGMAGYYEIDLLNGYGGLTLKHYIEYFQILRGESAPRLTDHPVVWTDVKTVPNGEMLRALDTKFIISDGSLRLDEAGYARMATLKNARVFVFYSGIERAPMAFWNLKQRLGPAYFASTVHPVHSEAESLAAIESSTSAREAYVLDLDGDVRESIGAHGSAKMVKRGINRYVYKVDSRKGGFLILSQIWYPGWRARSGDQELALYRTNHALIGCFVPPGAHEIVLEMTSPPMQIGLAIAACALVVLGTLFHQPVTATPSPAPREA